MLKKNIDVEHVMYVGGAAQLRLADSLFLPIVGELW